MSKTLTVEQEVLAILKTQSAQYHGISQALTGDTAYFYTEVGAALQNISRAYEEGLKPRPIEVGDTVRITQAYADSLGSALVGLGDNQVGVEFVVTDVVHSPWVSGQGVEYSFYVLGDPERRGIWDIFIERVGK